MSWRSWLGLPERMETRTLTDDNVPWGHSVPFNMAPSYPGTYLPSPTRALSLAAVYSANRLLAESISTLPLKTYRRGTDGRLPMDTLPQLFAQLVTDGQLVPWLHRCVTSLALRGNAYGLIINRDGFGFPTVI